MLEHHDYRKLLSKLQNFSIIVEGKKDKEALQALELHDIQAISGSSLEKFIPKLKYDKEYVVLTDFDREGELIKKKIYRFFEVERIKYNHALRREFKKIFRVVKIEELNKRGDIYYGENSSNNHKIFDRGKLRCRRFGGKT
ncbi:MAG: toprim domain-containing protein [Candidatus Aenigmatarchaeota archaeon]